MADPTLRPTDKTLRSARLLPQSQPEHYVVRGDRVPPQPEPISYVFGPARVQGGKTVVPLSQARYGGGPGKMVTRRVGVVEVGDDRVRVSFARRPLPLGLVGLLLVTWNAFWVWWIVRERRARET